MDIQYRINGGDWWTLSVELDAQAITIDVEEGDVVEFKGNNSQYSNGTSQFYLGNYSGSTAGYDVEGNIMSLIYGDEFEGKTSFPENTYYNFKSFFAESLNITSAENLVLPATTLTEGCYTVMFYNCASLTTAPELSVTTLANSCYHGMFNGCSSLTTAPELPATTLANYCYIGMFSNCTSLNYIKCLVTDISANACINWVSGVSETGTFVGVEGNPAGWIRGASGVPYGWECNFEIPEEPEGS